MRLERPPLFESGRQLGLFAALLCGIALLSLAFEYFRYAQLTRFDDALLDARVLHHYTKQKDAKRYSVLKLRSGGVIFYTTASEQLRDLRGRDISIRIKTDRIGYLEYLQGFYAHGTIERLYPQLSPQERLRRAVAVQHASGTMQELYGALFAAAPMGPELRSALGALGVSHLLAISGFHLGVIALLLYGLLNPPYAWLQQRYFPWRNRRRDLFLAASAVMFSYLWVLGFVPSLVRAFGMLAVGYWLYDRGMRIVSMQTLVVTVALLLAFWPRLAFSLGFWLSVAGVFYIFVFLIHWGHWKRWAQLLGVSVWVYLAMLPAALYLFGSFSLWHPMSVVWTLLFNLFYPLAALLHLAGEGALLDAMVSGLLAYGEDSVQIAMPGWAAVCYLVLSAAAVRYRLAALLLFFGALAVLVGAVYEVA